jgi:hypothetical protein
MRYLKFIIPVFACIAAVFVCSTLSAKKMPANGGFAVVELFTSEGCSSCPPADAVIARLEKQSADKPVYILAYHVDYWDRGGWKDAFSNSQYSDRQKQYAKWLLTKDGIYTPEVVINGKSAMVGSDEVLVNAVVSSNLQKQPAETIVLRDVKNENGNMVLAYQVPGADKRELLQLALVQKAAQTKVQRGENGGKTLSHVQIVRTFTTVPLTHADGRTTIAIPPGFNPHGNELIAFVQFKNTGLITGATKVAL